MKLRRALLLTLVLLSLGATALVFRAIHISSFLFLIVSCGWGIAAARLPGGSKWHFALIPIVVFARKVILSINTDYDDPIFVELVFLFVPIALISVTCRAAVEARE
jgi:hypothetical protein